MTPATPAAGDDRSIARYRANLQGEVDGAALYKTLAEAESDPHLAEIYRRATRRSRPASPRAPWR